MPVPQLKIVVAINEHLVGKNEGGNLSLFAHGWENVELTLDRFIATTTQKGVAYCAQLNGSRKSSNFRCCNVASVDVDHGLTIEEAIANPLVRQHSSFLYTTARHTIGRHRFRILFSLPETITAPSRMRKITRGLTRSLGGDMAATDPTRISFGNRGAEVHLIGGEVSPELMNELIADDALPDSTDLLTRHVVSRRSFVTLARDQELRLTDGRLMPLCDVPPKLVVHCPVHSDETPSAFVIQNRSGVTGVYCSTCSKSFWPNDRPTDEYDPDDFVKTTRAVAAISAVEANSVSHKVLGQPARKSFGERNVHFSAGQAAPAELLPGITFVRSDKGTGKTEAMKRLGSTVDTALLIGHRRTLIRGSCKRLNLECYLDVNRKGIRSGGGLQHDTASLLSFLPEVEDDS